MKNRYTIFRCLTALMSVLVGMCGCSDELDGIRNAATRPSEVICFTASLKDSPASVSRSSAGHLEMEQEEWLVDTEKVTQISRGTPTTLLSGSAGVIGYVYDGGWSTSVTPWTGLHNEEYVFDGDELTAKENDVRWNTLNKANAKFYVYAPYNLSGGTLSESTQGGAPKLTYNVNGTPANQHDLIVASWEGQANYKQSIPLTFEHVLTAIKFKVGFDCTVTKLEVKGIYNSGTYTFGEGWEVSSTTGEYEISSLTENNTLMMIPQELGPDAEVILHYTKDGQQETINSSLTDKVWQAGKMITYTIHETTAPTTIYFDLAAGDITLNQTTYTGARYISDGNGGYKADPVTGNHNDNNIYYVYQSTAAFNKDGYSILDNRGTVGNISGTFIRPPYSGVKGPNGEPWADYITNNKSVKDVIEMWDDGVYIKGSAASNEGSKSIAKVRDAGRTHTGNKISVSGAGKYKLTIDNIYSAFQQASTSRTTGGIAYTEGGAGSLTINSIGDNRVGCVHKDNSASSKLIFEGTGTLTVADTDFITNVAPANGTGDVGDLTAGYYSNHWNAAIGNNDGQNDCYGIVINSGIIFAGTTKAENCTAIGGGGNGTGDVTINGGIVTAVATTTGSAIGGGIGFHSNGGVGKVTITGGNVYAYNFANRWNIPSSAIGGGGTMESTVSKGTTINISGGNIYAESDLGTAIGGGSSYEQSGGEATINISGGKVVAKSNTNSAGIGGGCSITKGSSSSKLNGGDAIVNISGNPIIRTGSIGGGTTGAGQGKIGSAQITVSGGDIQAQFVMMNTGTGTKPKFEMSGGTIRNSYVDDEEYIHIKEQGGAVYLENGTFTMSGGTIKNCSAVQGGAVYIARKSTEPMKEDEFNFKMEGGEIHSCFATGGKIDDITYLGHGGAICLDGGQIHMWGGRIWNNYSENGNGGAVYISNGNFIMKNLSRIITNNYPTITGNTAHKGNGGGVFVSSENGKSVKVDLLQGVITNNTANNYGGGICVDMGETENSATVIVGVDGQGVTKETANPKISGNMAMMSGGGLYARGKNADITINSGMIDENEVSAYVKNENVANEKGAVTLNDGLVTHVVVTFNGNKAPNGFEGEYNGQKTYTQKIVTNTNSKLAPNLFTCSGCNFVGWNTRADGLGDFYSNEDVEPLSGNITLYAMWEVIQ